MYKHLAIFLVWTAVPLLSSTIVASVFAFILLDWSFIVSLWSNYWFNIRLCVVFGALVTLLVWLVTG